MNRGTRHPILMALACAAFLAAAFHLLAGPAYAHIFGRVTILVKDPDGNPVEGVKVSATTPELSRFKAEGTTNKKGKVTISVADATKNYDFRLEKEGFPPVDVPIKPQVRGTITREITFDNRGRQTVAADALEGGETITVYTPAERVFNEGVKLLKDGDMAGAKEKFIASLEKNPKMPLAHSALAGVYIEEKNFEEALASINRVLEMEPENTRALRMSYEADKALGNDKEAEAALTALSKLDKGGDTIAMLYNEGVQAARVDDLKSARARFEEVLELDSNMTHALTGMGLIHMNEKSYQDAVMVAEKILALEPENKRALQMRFDGYRGLGDQAKAKEALQALAAVDPTALIEEFFNKGVELFNGGDAAGAIAQFEAVLEIDPDHAHSHYRLGVSQVSAGDMAGAKEHLQKFLDLAPEDPEAPAAKDMLSYLN